MVKWLRRGKKVEKETLRLIAKVAAGYKYALELKQELNTIELEKDPHQARREVKQAIRFLKWVGQSERKIYRSERLIVPNLQAVNKLLSGELRSTNENLTEELRVAESVLIEKISFFQGKLKEEINEIAVYERLAEEYLSMPKKEAVLQERLKVLIEKTKSDADEVLTWMQSTEVILKSIGGFYSKLKAFVKAKEEEQKVDLRRRGLVKGLALGAGALALGIPRTAWASIRDSFFSDYDEEDQEKIKAIIYACEQIEIFCQNMTRKLSQSVIYTPHADYTHFNRVGKWVHKEIQAEAEKTSEDWGAHEESLFAKQRAAATAAKQATDKEVSIIERSLVTAANLVGRSRIRGKVFVAKHFPGGPAEIELTEVKKVSIENLDEVFHYLKPFEYLCQMPENKAVMISHVNYPELEEEFKSKTGEIDEAIFSELQEYGLKYDAYQKWILSRPASLSPAVIRGLLRGQLRFQGIVFPDAMQMATFTLPIQDFCTYFDSSKIKQAKISFTAESTFANILIIYAGVNFFLLHGNGDLAFIQEYAQAKPFFAKCVEEAFEKYQELHRLTGKTVPQAADVKGKVAILIKNETFPFNSDQDVWDRGGVIHRYFRSYYLAYLHKDKSMTTNIKRFWEVHQDTDWEDLDEFYELVLKNRYLRQA